MLIFHLDYKGILKLFILDKYNYSFNWKIKGKIRQINIFFIYGIG